MNRKFTNLYDFLKYIIRYKLEGNYLNDINCDFKYVIIFSQDDEFSIEKWSILNNRHGKINDYIIESIIKRKDTFLRILNDYDEDDKNLNLFDHWCAAIPYLIEKIENKIKVFE